MKRLVLMCAALAACSNNETAMMMNSQPDLSGPAPSPVPLGPERQIIVFVWDGMRPDSITQEDTPVLFTIKNSGSYFSDNHSTYPTFTMMNAASLATGGFPGTTGFYGNSLWQPGPTGKDSANGDVNFNNPVFTEDYAILQDLDAYYQNQLLLVGTLFQAAQDAGLPTAAVGKSGPAFLQDRKKGGYIIDEKMVWPLSLAEEIQAVDALPATSNFAYPSGTLTIPPANGTPTSSRAKITLADKASSDPTDQLGAPTNGQNSYMMRLYLDHVLPKQPVLSLIWFRAPDSPEHNYGPGSYDYHDALRAQDYLLGLLVKRLHDLGIGQKTDIIIVSDHGHSSVSGPTSLFPLRKIVAGASGAPGTIGDVDPAGFSVSGDVRIADLLAKGGFTNVFDGQGCLFVPEMSGHKADGSYVYPTQVDMDGSLCGRGPMFNYTTGPAAVPATLPAKAIVIATNGGSDYLYVPDHDAATVGNVVRFLQSREEVGAVFVHSRYGALPGTLPLDAVHLENAGRAPDVIFSYDFDEHAAVAGMPGIEFESMASGNNRGMHGSFSPIDVHNTLVAIGPDFKGQFDDPLPTGNVDVAPTVAQLLGLSLPKADGRVLAEALFKDGVDPSVYRVAPEILHAAAPATGLTFALPTDPTGAAIDAGKSTYDIDLQVKTLKRGDQSWTYFDFAKATRQ